MADENRKRLNERLSWEAEQDEYRLGKEHSVDAAAICAVGMLLATLIAASVWAWHRYFPT